MKRQGGLLIAVLAGLVGVFSGGAVQAAPSSSCTDLHDASCGTHDWVWKAANDAADVEVIVASSQPGYGFYISSLAGSPVVTLIGTVGTDIILSDSLKMVKKSGGGYELEIKSYNSLTQNNGSLVSTNTVALNADLEFIFGFSTTGGVGKLDTIYEIWKEQDEGHFTFTDLETAITADFKGAKYTPSAVPVPSSALLLGSSILGLAGFGSRRKKSQAV